MIRGKVSPAPVGVMGPVAEDGKFDYGCAVQVKPATPLPKELRKLEVLAHRYAVFTHEGHISEIRCTYEEIWNRALIEHGLTMVDRPGFEFHNPEFDPSTGKGGVAIWVPIVSRPVIAPKVGGVRARRSKIDAIMRG
jgi:AraC family transcriptional regulator